MSGIKANRIKTCELCGCQFVAKNKRARFCSSSCRAKNYRGAFVPPIEPPKITIIMDIEEVHQIVSNAHASASDLSRASKHTEPPLSNTLGRVAADFEESLRREGL